MGSVPGKQDHDPNISSLYRSLACWVFGLSFDRKSAKNVYILGSAMILETPAQYIMPL